MTEQQKRQKVFNKIAKHLLTQNKRADYGSFCVYKGGGRKCAIGCLIPSNLYTVELEGVPLVNLPDPVLDSIGYLKASEKTRNLMKELQLLHDHECVSEWSEHLDFLAKRYKLSTWVLKRKWKKKKKM